MSTLRPRVTVAVLVFLAAGLSACAAGPTAPVDLDSKEKVSADVDTTKRGPTTPWTSVQSTTPAIPWN
jgi:hypothetical protein